MTVTQMTVLVPVRYPLTEINRLAINEGLDRTRETPESELIVFHMNDLGTDQRIDRETLREAVESYFDGIEASYVVRHGFLVEEAVIEEAIRLEVDVVVLSEERRRRWERLLGEILDVEKDPETYIRDRTGVEIEIVSEIS